MKDGDVVIVEHGPFKAVCLWKAANTAVEDGAAFDRLEFHSPHIPGHVVFYEDELPYALLVAIEEHAAAEIAEQQEKARAENRTED